MDIISPPSIKTKPIEYARLIQRCLTNNPDLTITELAYKMNKSVDWLDKMRSLLKIEETKLQELVDEGKINLDDAYLLSLIPANEQVEYAKKLGYDY